MATRNVSAMPYIVKRIQGVYEDSTRDAYEDAVGEFLSEHESDGFRLVAVIPQHYSYDEAGERDGTVSPLLVLHRDEAV